MGKDSLPFLCDDKKKSLQVVFLIFRCNYIAKKSYFYPLFNFYGECF